jgi:putative transposase
MAFKTLMLQLYKPSKHKRDLIDISSLHYSQSLQFLLDRYHDEIENLSKSKIDVTQRTVLKMIDKETAKSLNHFDMQPFKDSIKIEFATIVVSYIALKRKKCETGYPLTFLDEPRYHFAISDCIQQYDGGEIGRRNFEHHCSKYINQAGKLHSLYFGRYAMNRDYCLLYDEFKDRFYAKIYLLNRKESITGGEWSSGLSLKYVWADTPPVINKPGKKRYIIVPLAFGKKQYADLIKTLKNPRLLRSARLIKKKNLYYLMVNMECSQSDIITASTTMGLSRNSLGGLNFTVCDESGVVRESGRILKQPNQISIFSFLNKIAEIAMNNRSQIILEANGGKNDRMPFQSASKDCCLSTKEYWLLGKKLKYKLPEQRLPPPIEVSANGLFFTCPGCGTKTQRNLISEELFACIHCGYASESEWIGSENLAKRLYRYRDDKIPISILIKEDGLLCFNKILGFEYALPQGITDYTSMYEHLDQFIKSMDGIYINDSKKYAVWKKLSLAPNLENSIRFIFK